MLGFFKKKSLYGANYPHLTQRTDWDALSDQLFDQVIQPFKSGLAVLSFQGDLSSQISSRIKPSIPEELRDFIRQFSVEHFRNIFSLAAQQEPEVSDCYVTRNLGLPNNSLVFLIESQASKNKEPARILLVFGSPYIKQDLDRHLGLVSQYLKSSPAAQTESTLQEPVSKPSETTFMSTALSKRQLPKTKPDVIKARLNYLESLEQRSQKQSKEMAMLEEYLQYLFRKSMEEKLQ